MMGLLDSEIISMIMFSRSDTKHACASQPIGRTDGRTDGIGVAYTRYSIYAVARKMG